MKGKGKIPNRFLIIGEYPSKPDDVLGEPFTGAPGKLLDIMLSRAGIAIEECYYTMAIWCRPTDTKGGVTRWPKDDEMISCASNILKIYDKCNPNRVILVGKTAQEFYGKVFPGHCKIFAVDWLVKQGGIGCVHFTDMVQRLRRLV